MVVHEFSELVDLKKIINEDLEDFHISASRFPVRFIFLNSHEELKEIVNLLVDKAKIVELSSFLFSNESWLSVDQVIDEIKNLDENSVIVPFSEFIRFLDDTSFKRILNGLAEIENKNFKLYVPLVGLWDRFEDLFWKDYYRKDNWAPIWKMNTSHKQIKIYQVNFEFNDKISTNGLKLISTTKEWFEFWKEDNIEKIISLTQSLSINFHNSLPDQTFTQEIIKTPKEYLSKIFDMNLNVAYDEREKIFWDNLLIDVSKINKKNLSFKDIFSIKFNRNNISNINVEDYLDLYLNQINERYYQWIIKCLFIESDDYENTYLAHCFKSMQNVSNNNLARKIFLEIFKLDYSEDFLDERRLLLKKFNKFEFSEKDFENQFKNIEHLNYKQQLKYLTTTTFTEKFKIIEIIQDNNLDNCISDLKVIFPELYYYLDWNLNLNSEIPLWIVDYFREYNKSKLLNFKSDKIDSLLSKNNNPDNFYDWYFNTHNNYNIDENNYVIWIDGLGAEWLPLLSYFLNYYGKKNNKCIKYKTISSVNLPSATKFNKIVADKKISYLDEYIHKNHYNYPKSLLDELDYVKKISKSIVQIDSPKISIVSDHGFSFLCTKKFGGYKKYTFESSKHEGRYMLWDKEDIENEDYISTKSGSFNHEDEKYIVPLRHISLYNTPSHEVHGGATPEEILVPYFILENDESLNIDYDVSPLKNEINISMNADLPIDIFPEPNSLPMAICNNESLSVIKKDNDYVIQLNSNLNKGYQKITIKIDDIEVGEFDVNITKGGIKEDDYDDLFN